MSPEVAVALIGIPSSVLLGVSAVFQAAAAMRTARRTTAKLDLDLKTNHGRRPGEYLELIHSDLAELRMLVLDHVTDREIHRVDGHA